MIRITLRAVPACFWVTVFLYRYSSTITAPSPSPIVATIYKPSLLYLAFLHFLFPRLHLPSAFLPTPIYAYNMPIQPLYRPVLHYIQLYRLCYPRRRHAYTAATHDAIIIVSSCYVIGAGAPLTCQLIGVAMRPLSPRRPITGRLGTRHAWQDALSDIQGVSKRKLVIDILKARQ